MLEQGQLPGRAVPPERHGLVGQRHGDGFAVPGRELLGRRRGDPDQRGAAVGDPVRADGPARGEDRRVGAAAVKTEQHRRVRADHRPQLGHHPGQRGGQCGRLARTEDHGF